MGRNVSQEVPVEDTKHHLRSSRLDGRGRSAWVLLFSLEDRLTTAQFSPFCVDGLLVLPSSGLSSSRAALEAGGE